MHFRVRGLPLQQFAPLIHANESELERNGVRRVLVDRPSGFPDRITLADVAIGQTVLLMNYEHQPAPTPYRAQHAIYVWENAAQPFDDVDVIPPALRARMLSLRAFDCNYMMIDADLVAGADCARSIERLLSNASVSYIHAHYAQRGCYAAHIDRA